MKGVRATAWSHFVRVLLLETTCFARVTACFGADTASGRWKALHYMLGATTFADQIVACNQAAQCFAKNDSPFEFSGELSLQLRNVQTGTTALVRRLPLKLSAGAGTVQWFCASNSSSSSTTSALGGNYSYHPCQVPTVGAFVAHHFPTVVSQLQCQAWCDANNTCADTKGD